MTDETCGHPTANGEPCQNPATDGNSCWIPNHGGTADDHGRPSKFTYKRGHLALEAAREGKSKDGCARDAGVHRSTLDEWADWDDGMAFGPLYFPAAFAQARGDGESDWIAEGRGDDGDASFAKFMLASSYDYKKTEKREVTGEDGSAITVASKVVEITEDDV